MEEEKQGRAAAAKQWLENLLPKVGTNGVYGTEEELLPAQPFDSVALAGLSICRTESFGYLLCSYKVPKHLTDSEGNWHTGAIATLIDVLCAATIMTTEGHIKVSVSFNISYYSTAKINEELEIEGKVVGRKGRLSEAVVEIRKKDGGRELVASGKQWMSSPLNVHTSSKL